MKCKVGETCKLSRYSKSPVAALRWQRRKRLLCRLAKGLLPLSLTRMVAPSARMLIKNIVCGVILSPSKGEAFLLLGLSRSDIPIGSELKVELCE